MNTRASGLAGLTCRLESALELVSSAALAGAGLIGDSTGIITIRFITIIATTPGAEPSTTGTLSTGELRRRVAAFVQERRRGLPHSRVGRGLSSIVLAERRSPLREARPLPGATLRPAVKAEFTRALSATTTMAERHERIPRAEAPASVAERVVVEDMPVAVGTEAEVDMAADTTDLGSFE